MHRKFDHKAIEEKWQADWNESGIYNEDTRDESKEKEYVLVELPYPSGNLHIGHWYAFAVPDIYVRFKRMMGKQVLYPMGFDAFGLPAENAAIKRNVNPREWTESNIAYMKTQLASMGNSFTWNNTAATIDPNYYRWTQWMFTEFFKNNIAYRGEGKVNWCPTDNTVIANEQVLADDTCERCGDTIEKRVMPQWMLRITDYADALIDDLDSLDWPEHIKDAQRAWIGRSEGASIAFKLSTDDTVTVFTTRPDTLYGATYMVLAPEHELITKHKDTIANWSEVAAYRETTAKKKEMDRLDNTKEKTGVKLEGITATNPANGEAIPVYIADYVLAGYGTGAIMAVPAHDERDHAFAHKFGIKIQSVIAPQKITHAGALLEVGDKPGTFLFQKRTMDCKTNPGKLALFGGRIEQGETVPEALIRELQEELELNVTTADFNNSYCYPSQNVDSYICATHIMNINPSTLSLHEGEAIVEMTLDEACESDDLADSLRSLIENPIDSKKITTQYGVLHNSEEFDGMDSEEAKVAITEKVGGKMTNTYRLRDWSIGRQRYWGVPIPIVYDPEGKAHVVPEEHLPWTLPEDVDFRPTGEPPLAKSAELKKRTEDIFGAGWTPEVETMDTFVDSSWYFLRYIDPNNTDSLASMQAQKDWMPVDLYFGGAEHTTMHLLYSRFWQKALFKMGLVSENEPYKRRINRGLILGPDGNKMSKSKGNVIDPDEQVQLVGSDTVKMYLAFMGPYQGNNYPWDLGGVAGLRRFLERVNGLNEHVLDGDVDESPETIRQLHKTIKKVSADIEAFKFNTAISAMMIFINVAEKEGLSDATYATFLQLLAPFAPHLSEELWMKAGGLQLSSGSEQSEELSVATQSEAGQRRKHSLEINSIHLQSFPEFDPALAKDDQVTIGVQINGKMRGEITIEPDADEATATAATKNNPQLQEKFVGATIQKVIYVPGRILNFIVTK